MRSFKHHFHYFNCVIRAKAIITIANINWIHVNECHISASHNSDSLILTTRQYVRTIFVPTFFLSLLFLSFPLLPFVWQEGYTSQALTSAGFFLDSTNGRHWCQIRWCKERWRQDNSPSLSLGQKHLLSNSSSCLVHSLNHTPAPMEGMASVGWPESGVWECHFPLLPF